MRVCFRVWRRRLLTRVAWALVPDCVEGSMFRHWRNGGQCWSNDDKKTTLLNLTQNQVKDLQETLCKRRKKRRKTERGTTCPPLTKNTNHRITKEIRTENAATVKHFQKKKIITDQSEEALKALNRHSQRGACPKTGAPNGSVPHNICSTEKTLLAGNWGFGCSAGK